MIKQQLLRSSPALLIGFILSINTHKDILLKIRPTLIRLEAEAAFSFFVLAFSFKLPFLQGKEKNLLPCSAVYAPGTLCLICSGMTSKMVFLITLWEITERHIESLRTMMLHLQHSTQVGPHNYTFLRGSTFKAPLEDQNRRINPRARSRTHGQTCSSISVFPNAEGITDVR